MTQTSLRRRLGLIGGLAIAVAVGLSVTGLSLLFDRHVERVAVSDLEKRTYSVAAMIELTAGDAVILGPGPEDPTYQRPFSGHYWQVELGAEIRRSRSLWDVTLPRIGPPLPPGTERVLEMAGPRDEPLLAFETWLSVGPDATPVRILVATDRATLDTARAGFIGDLLPYSVVLGLLLLLAFWVQVTLGMRPLRAVSTRVAGLRSGRIPRMGTELPVEVLPLAAEIDVLLADREAELKRARNRAGDLAHGLKTPLQALLGDAAQLRDRGDTAMAEGIETVVTAMQRLVDRELRRARIQTDRGHARADLRAVVSGVIKVLERTPDGAALDWSIDLPAGLWLAIDPEDLAEAIGALAENAARHARTRVDVDVSVRAGAATIRIRDDGAGPPPGAMQDLVRRGFRADESAGGHGIGLSIVAAIVEAAGGDLAFSTAADGASEGTGLAVLMTLAVHDGPA